MLKSWQFWTPFVLALGAILVYRATIPTDDEDKAPPRRVAIITGGSGEYWQAAIEGAKQAAKQRGIELVVRSPTNAENAEQQMQLLSQVATSDIDAVAISPIDAERQAKMLTELAGVKPLVTFDSDSPDSARHGYVGTSNSSAGLVAGTLVKKAIPEGGQVAVVLANRTKQNLIDRLAGLRTRIAESPVPEESATDPRFSIVDVSTDEGDSDSCSEHIKQLLDQYPDLACLVTLNARQGPVAIAVLEELGVAERAHVIAFDTPDATLDGVERGVVYAAIAQDPYSYGFEAVGMLDALCRGDQHSLPVVGRAAVHISVEPITRENLAEFRKRFAGRKAASGGST